MAINITFGHLTKAFIQTEHMKSSSLICMSGQMLGEHENSTPKGPAGFEQDFDIVSNQIGFHPVLLSWVCVSICHTQAGPRALCGTCKLKKM